MLRLNSTYAKSYFRDNEISTNFANSSFDPRRQQESIRDLQLRSRTKNISNRPLLLEREDRSNRQNIHSYKPSAQCTKNQLLRNNQMNHEYRDQLQPTMSNRNNTKDYKMGKGLYSKDYQLKKDEIDTQNQLVGTPRLSKYERYSQQPDTRGNEGIGFAAKHNRRNEQAKNRLHNEMNYQQSVRDTLEDKNYYQNYGNGEPFQRNISPYDQYREQDLQNFNKQKRPLNRTNYQELHLSQPLAKLQSEETSRLDASLIQRKEAFKRSFDNTPEKGFRAKFEPGSAERKNSLIEKSQLLQEKLKKLNSQNPTTEPFCEQRYQQKQYGSRFDERPLSNRADRTEQINQTISNNIGNGRPSRRLQSTHNGQAIEKISQLNQKINQRIQSIISNYSKQ